jgi:transcriptional regulator with XRE-family HTH domain
LVRHKVDFHVGNRMRRRRIMIGLSRQCVAKAMGQKYETGANALNAIRLYQLAQLLAVPISYFFEELERPAAAHAAETPYRALERQEEGLQDSHPDAVKIMIAFREIPDPVVRRRVANLIRALSKASATDRLDESLDESRSP